MRVRARQYGQVRSTNDLVKQAIDEGIAEGFVARATRQTGGYGRQGRRWESPVGGLYASWLLRPTVPTEELSTLSLVMGLAVRDAVVSLGAPSQAVAVKWPNDVVVVTQEPASAGAAFAKLCGISTETRGNAVCVGIGVNVREPVITSPVTPSSIAAGKNTPAYLERLVPSLATQPLNDALDVVFDALSRALTRRYQRWQAHGFKEMTADFNRADPLEGRPVTIVDRGGNPQVAGIAQGVDHHGRLLVSPQAGVVIPVTSGEAHLRVFNA